MNVTDNQQAMKSPPADQCFNLLSFPTSAYQLITATATTATIITITTVITIITVVTIISAASDLSAVTNKSVPSVSSTSVEITTYKIIVSVTHKPNLLQIILKPADLNIIYAVEFFFDRTDRLIKECFLYYFQKMFK